MPSLSSSRLFATALLISSGAAAQDTNLQDLERRLNAAKQEEQQKQNAAAAQQRAQANMATLVVKSDAACELTVNGSAQGALSAGVTKAVKVPPGEQLIECRAASGAVAQETKTIGAGAQAVATLAMPRFADIGGGVVVDSMTGLHYQQSDNGYDIDWPSAGQYCAQKGYGWRLPNSNELSPLVGKYGNGDTAMAPFRLTDRYAWTNERNGSSEAWDVDLYDGNRGSIGVSDTDGARALCVRRP